MKKSLGKPYDERWLSLYRLANPQANLFNYIPDDYFYTYIDPVFNKPRATELIDDKNLYDLFFYDVKRPKTIVRIVNGLILDEEYGIINVKKAIDLCKSASNVIIKPAINFCGGKGIVFWEKEKNTEEELKQILTRKDVVYVIQEIVRQHEELQRIHKESLNTIRIMTLLWNNQVKVLSSVIRMGSGNMKVDNVSSGGMACGIMEDGHLKEKAYDGLFNMYKEHPQGGIFSNFIVPNFSKCIELVKHLAPRVEEFSKLIGWDVAINQLGEPVLIEANLFWHELDFHQLCNGPIFGSETEEVLTYVKHNFRNVLD